MKYILYLLFLLPVLCFSQTPDINGTPQTISTGLTLAGNLITSDIITGKAGGQTAIGGTAAGENLLLNATTNGTKGYVGIPYAPRATANYGSFSMGAGPFDGSTSGFFTGSANGTQQAINMASGSTADYQNFQIAGVKVYKLSNSGQGLYHANGAASTPILYLDGTIFTGGSATTSKPHLLIEPSGTTSTGWNALGSLIGANASSGFNGNLIDLQLNGSTKFSVNSTGATVVGNGITTLGPIQSASVNTNSNLYVVGSSLATNLTTAQFLFAGASGTMFRTAFYGSTSTQATASYNTANVLFSNAPQTTAASGTHAIMSNVAIRPIGVITSSGATITNTATLYIESASAAGTNNYVLWTDAGTNRFDGITGIGGVTTPTALLHLAAGTATASTAPLKLTTGTLNTTAESGTMEYNNVFYQTKASGLRYALGGVIADFYTDANNTGTGETDIYSYTTPASTLAADGSKITAVYAGTFNDLTATARLKVLFGGTEIANTGALTVSATGGWKADVLIIRTGATTARSIVNISTPGASTAVYTSETDLTGLTLSGTNILKITATAGGGTGGDNDITGKLGTISWWGVSAN